MVAPPGWQEPFQTPEFDEVTLIIEGQKQIEFEDETIILNEGESIFVPQKSRVRYSNPFAKPCKYVSFCIPAFSIDRVNRESN
jgi:ethanolamine utilization protein EutQ (cupin superfamily)